MSLPSYLFVGALFAVGVNGRRLSVPEQVRLFPLVETLKADGGCCARLSPQVEVNVASTAGGESPSLIITNAAARTQGVLRRFAMLTDASSSKDEGMWSVERIIVEPPARGSQGDSYELTCKQVSRECVIKASGVFGAITALQSTLIQLFSHGGAASFQNLHVADSPQYPVRGIMMDLGRRFIPKSVILSQIIDGMALTRMNFLHLHLSDFCRFSVALPGFPELSQGGMMEGQYTLQDIREIVEYARDRGIRVVPEVDLPAHSKGLLSLKKRGLQFCEPEDLSNTLPEHAAKIYDDPAGNGRALLRRLLQETTAAFGPDEDLFHIGGRRENLFHIGGDEVKADGRCTISNVVDLQEYLTRDVLGSELNRTVLGWGELLLKEKRSDGERAVGGTKDAILVAWQGAEAVKAIVKRGHRVIAAPLDHHYLDTDNKDRPLSMFWYDVAAEHGVKGKDRENLLGGMGVMWTDRYCYKYQCGAAGEAAGIKSQDHTMPAVPVMFRREFDDSFAKSLSGMVWPRAGITAGALWRYSDEVTPDELSSYADWLARLLRDVGGIATCPPGCICDEVASCGMTYPIVQSPTQEASLLEECFTWSGGDGRSLGDDEKELNDLRRCFWEGPSCRGVGRWTRNSASKICSKLEAGDQDATEDKPAVPSTNTAAAGAAWASDIHAVPVTKVAPQSSAWPSGLAAVSERTAERSEQVTASAVPTAAAAAPDGTGERRIPAAIVAVPLALALAVGAVAAAWKSKSRA